MKSFVFFLPLFIASPQYMQRMRRFESPINMFLSDSAKNDVPSDAGYFGGPAPIGDSDKYNDYMRLFQLN
ncbi:Oidioi.mRNA.OKI2018_I69.chr2.g4551.t1.cds [Oikopleura dioica]|uniref:Oidioi.mRNA.OKI2018_I69.chr2.g4551.t1.cds n=1 Tax=Oikopleura dioica TaxID=34765 RepID=A0ABN7SY41_OIKDI|nr:Oidioi.mRNA.OKI2018_I69.chr2.g4551.t1.cds [Oikopleura dioica]